MRDFFLWIFLLGGILRDTVQPDECIRWIAANKLEDVPLFRKNRIGLFFNRAQDKLKIFKAAV